MGEKVRRMLDETLIKNSLKTSFFGKYLYVFPEIGSTNSYARELVKQGAPEGTVILTDYQKNGKGRLGRTWQSTRGANILMSLILRPRMNIEAIQCITLATADIVIITLEKFLKKEGITNVRFKVKWPNDIMIDGKKIAGILCESSVQDKSVEYVIVGLGINVNQDIKQLSKDIRKKTTSLFVETSKHFQREKLIAQFLLIYEKKYIDFERTNYEQGIQNWKKRCSQMGNSYMIKTPVIEEWGRLEGVDSNGVLLYRTQDGKIKKLIAGNVKYESAGNGAND